LFPKAVWFTPRVTRVHQSEASRRQLRDFDSQGKKEGGGKRRTSSNVTAVVLSSKSSKGSPSATNVKKSVGRLKVELLADELELVVLELLERLGSGDVPDESGGVDHPWSKEPIKHHREQKVLSGMGQRGQEEGGKASTNHS
jgi:hypothetical protein